MNVINYTKHSEGVDHINASSQSLLRAGRFLTNFAETEIKTKDHGSFASLEAYWYWLSVREDSIRPLFGKLAKKEGQRLRKAKASELIILPDLVFQSYFKQAIDLKIEGTKNVKGWLLNNPLPIVHYLTFTRDDKEYIKRPESCNWVWDHYNSYCPKVKLEPKDTINQFSFF